MSVNEGLNDPLGQKQPLSGSAIVSFVLQTNQTVIALVAAAMTVLLVVAVTLLMAFIEYQSRLTRYQPGIRTSEIIDSVGWEAEAEREIAWQADHRKELQEAIGALQLARREVQFKIERICSLFTPRTGGAVSADEQTLRCYGFLSRVPFDGTIVAPVVGSDGPREPVPPATATTSERSAAFQKVVLSSFVRIMGGDDPQSPVADYLPAFSADIVRIALLNQDIFTRLTYEAERLRGLYLTSCLRSAELKSRMTYVDTAPSPCAAEVDYSLAIAPLVGPSPSSLAQPPSAERAESDVGRVTASPDPGVPAPIPTVPPSSGSKSAIGQGNPQVPSASDQLSFDPNRMEKQRRFELVQQFRIYNKFTSDVAKHLLLSPPDYLATWLLIFGGALGSMLKIVFRHLMPTRTVQWSDLLVESAQGLACAVMLFILFRSGVVVIAGNSNQSIDAAPLSSYFVAFLAIGAGLMSDQVMQAFRTATGAFIGRGTPREPSRWAVGLKAALELQDKVGRPISVQEFANRLGIIPSKFEDWKECRMAVEGEYQDKIRLVLGTPLSRLFTDIDPNIPLPRVETEEKNDVAAEPAEQPPPQNGAADAAAEPTPEPHEEEAGQPRARQVEQG